MKMRIKGNSIRLRLTRGEVDTLGREGRVTERIAFGAVSGPALIYELVSDVGTERLSAWFADGRITVSVPLTVAREWMAGETVGIEAEQDLGPEGTLRILVEKDFACLKPREGEDDADAYPHPAEGLTC